MRFKHGFAKSKGITYQSSSLRAREPIGRSFGLVRGKFPSKKMGRMIHWESQLERDAALLFEFSPAIAAYREQPFRIHYSFNGKIRRYTPDFEVKLQTGEIQIIEVKPLARSLEPHEAYRLSEIRRYFEGRGYTYRILTEADIRQIDLLKNLWILMRYRGADFSAFDKRVWREKLGSTQSMSFAEAEKILGGKDNVWMLLDQQVIGCDLRHEITEATYLKPIQGGNHDTEFF